MQPTIAVELLRWRSLRKEANTAHLHSQEYEPASRRPQNLHLNLAYGDSRRDVTLPTKHRWNALMFMTV